MVTVGVLDGSGVIVGINMRITGVWVTVGTGVQKKRNTKHTGVSVAVDVIDGVRVGVGVSVCVGVLVGGAVMVGTGVGSNGCAPAGLATTGKMRKATGVGVSNAVGVTVITILVAVAVTVGGFKRSTTVLRVCSTTLQAKVARASARMPHKRQADNPLNALRRRRSIALFPGVLLDGVTNISQFVSFCAESSPLPTLIYKLVGHHLTVMFVAPDAQFLNYLPHRQ
jgi:hypothetical protein